MVVLQRHSIIEEVPCSPNHVGDVKARLRRPANRTEVSKSCNEGSWVSSATRNDSEPALSCPARQLWLVDVNHRKPSGPVFRNEWRRKGAGSSPQ